MGDHLFEASVLTRLLEADVDCDESVLAVDSRPAPPAVEAEATRVRAVDSRIVAIGKDPDLQRARYESLRMRSGIVRSARRIDSIGRHDIEWRHPSTCGARPGARVRDRRYVVVRHRYHCGSAGGGITAHQCLASNRPCDDEWTSACDHAAEPSSDSRDDATYRSIPLATGPSTGRAAGHHAGRLSSGTRMTAESRRTAIRSGALAVASFCSSARSTTSISDWRSARFSGWGLRSRSCSSSAVSGTWHERGRGHNASDSRARSRSSGSHACVCLPRPSAT
jgi:hypothetical protein